MERNVNITNAGVYIKINQTPEEVSDFFCKHDTDIAEWLSGQEVRLFNQGNMPANIICAGEKYDLSNDITCFELKKLRATFLFEYKKIIEELSIIFGSGNVDVRIGIVEYKLTK